MIGPSQGVEGNHSAYGRRGQIPMAESTSKTIRPSGGRGEPTIPLRSQHGCINSALEASNASPIDLRWMFTQLSDNVSLLTAKNRKLEKRKHELEKEVECLKVHVSHLGNSKKEIAHTHASKKIRKRTAGDLSEIEELRAQVKALSAEKTEYATKIEQLKDENRTLEQENEKFSDRLSLRPIVPDTPRVISEVDDHDNTHQALTLSGLRGLHASPAPSLLSEPAPVAVYIPNPNPNQRARIDTGTFYASVMGLASNIWEWTRRVTPSSPSSDSLQYAASSLRKLEDRFAPSLRQIEQNSQPRAILMYLVNIIIFQCLQPYLVGSQIIGLDSKTASHMKGLCDILASSSSVHSECRK